MILTSQSYKIIHGLLKFRSSWIIKTTLTSKDIKNSLFQSYLVLYLSELCHDASANLPKYNIMKIGFQYICFGKKDQTYT